jgi:hypothetical protein
LPNSGGLRVGMGEMKQTHASLHYVGLCGPNHTARLKGFAD